MEVMLDKPATGPEVIREPKGPGDPNSVMVDQGPPNHSFIEDHGDPGPNVIDNQGPPKPGTSENLGPPKPSTIEDQGPQGPAVIITEGHQHLQAPDETKHHPILPSLSSRAASVGPGSCKWKGLPVKIGDTVDACDGCRLKCDGGHMVKEDCDIQTGM